MFDAGPIFFLRQPNGGGMLSFSEAKKRLGLNRNSIYKDVRFP